MKDDTFNNAKQLYLEQYGSAIVIGGHLRIAVTVLSLVILGLVAVNLKIVRTLDTFKPTVIRIDEIGRAQAVNYENLAYKPEYKETKYFLTRFCQLYYRRNHATINDDFTQALYFLDGKLAGDTIQQFKQKNIIKSFLADSTAPERISMCNRWLSNPWRGLRTKPPWTSSKSSTLPQITLSRSAPYTRPASCSAFVTGSRMPKFSPTLWG